MLVTKSVIMRNRETAINSIIDHLSILQVEVEIRSKVNLQDINVHAEQFYKILLNLIYSYSLENINISEQNAAVIDLACTTNRVAIQVTSNNKKDKITETVYSFCNKELYKKYDRLIMLIIKTKTSRQDSITVGNFTFDLDKDVIDIPELVRSIQNIDDLDRIIQIQNWLFKELVEKRNTARNEISGNEVLTFVGLIEILSDEHNHKIFELETPPDPKFKIEERFNDYAPYLNNLYIDLLIEYGHALKVAQDEANITSVQIRKVSLFLKDISNRHLISSNNDPKEALENLCVYLSNFFKNGVKYDEMAIKFYLIDQLIKCNVFPNNYVVNI